MGRYGTEKGKTNLFTKTFILTQTNSSINPLTTA